MTNFYIPLINLQFFTNRIMEDAASRGKSCVVHIGANGRVLDLMDTETMQEAG